MTTTQQPKTGARRVLVTGGGTGIGRAVAEAVLAAGGAVVVAGRRREPLDALVHAGPEGRVFALPCDLANDADRATLLRDAKQLLGGRIDGVVHSAGEVRHQPLGEIDDGSLRAQLEINLVAALRLGEDALHELDDGGALVFVSSTLAVRPVPTSAVYSAAKAGTLALVKTFALTGAPRRVRCNAVLPGIVETDMVRGRDLDALRALHPIGRLGAPADVAEAVLYLLQASWTTGAELVVDGGLLLRE